MEFSPRRMGRAAAKALAPLNPRSTASFTGKVLLEPDPASQILISPVISSVNADNVQRGRSLWAGMLDQEAASQELTLIDDDLLPRGWPPQPLDSEGVQRRRTGVIAEGRLKVFLHNSYTASKEGEEIHLQRPQGGL